MSCKGLSPTHSDHPLGTSPGFQAGSRIRDINSGPYFSCRNLIFSDLFFRPEWRYRVRQLHPKHHQWSYELPDSQILRYENHQVFRDLQDLLSEQPLHMDLPIFSLQGLHFQSHWSWHEANFFLQALNENSFPGQNIPGTFTLDFTDSPHRGSSTKQSNFTDLLISYHPVHCVVVIQCISYCFIVYIDCVH